MGSFYSFYSLYRFLHKFFAVLTTFCNFCHNSSSCWPIYCAVGVPDDASTVFGISTIFGIPAVVGPLSAVDACNVPKSLLVSLKS
jgi:hypothetical protein